MSKPTPPTYITPQTCYNISYFRSILKDLRILEDSLAPKLNATLAVSKTNEDGCKSFVKALSNAYEQRKSLIEYCGTVVGEEVDRLKKMQEEVKGDRKQEAVLKGKVDVEQTQVSSDLSPVFLL